MTAMLRKATVIRHKRAELGDRLARAMAPEAWAEYDAGKGRCTNHAGQQCLVSIDHAGKALDVLTELGFPIEPKS